MFFQVFCLLASYSFCLELSSLPVHLSIFKYHLYCNNLSTFLLYLCLHVPLITTSIVAHTVSYRNYHLSVFLTRLNCMGHSDSQYIGHFCIFSVWLDLAHSWGLICLLILSVKWNVFKSWRGLNFMYSGIHIVPQLSSSFMLMFIYPGVSAQLEEPISPIEERILEVKL